MDILSEFDLEAESGPDPTPMTAMLGRLTTQPVFSVLGGAA